MAALYTYDDFYKKAQASGLLGQFSEADLKLAQQNPEYGMSTLQRKIDYGNATTDEARALIHSEQEANRASLANYSGGADGSGYYLLTGKDSSGYKDTGSALATQRDTALAGLLNRQPFSFDPATSQEYGAYKKQYLREGDRAESNALAQASALTGGMPSTAAVTAASQAGDYYASQLTDKLPEIYENEYSRYLNEYNMDLNMVNLLNSMEQDEYSRGVAADETDYGRGIYSDETQYGRGIYADELARSDADADRALAQEEVAGMIAIGRMPNDDLIARSGYTKETVAAQVAYNANLIAQKAAGGTGGGGPGEEGEAEGTYTAAQRKFYENFRKQTIANFNPDKSLDPYNLLQSSPIYKQKMGDYLYSLALKEAKNYSVGNYQPPEAEEQQSFFDTDWTENYYYNTAKAMMADPKQGNDAAAGWLLQQNITDDQAAAIANMLKIDMTSYLANLK